MGKEWYNNLEKGQYDNKKIEKVELNSEYELFLNKFIEVCSQSFPTQFVTKRKYDPEIIKSLNIGLADDTALSKFRDENCADIQTLNNTGFFKDKKFMYKNRVIIPFNSYYFSARSQDPKVQDGFKNLFPKKDVAGSKRPYFIRGTSDVVIMVEGETDAIACRHIYPEHNIVAVGGVQSSLNVLKTMPKDLNSVWLCLDNDIYGEEWTKKSINYLKKKNIPFKVAKFDSKYKDIDDLYREKLKESEKYIMFEEPSEKNLLNHQDIIFEENEIIKEAPFNYSYDSKTKKTVLGLYLTKWHTYTPKDTEEEITTQVKTPYCITSDNEILSVGQHKKANNITIPVIPGEEIYPLRWELKDIQNYLKDIESDLCIEFNEILNKIEGIYKEYVYFSAQEWYKVQALWDIGTYFYQLFDYYPLMELRGLKGTGKTKVMTISRQISFMASEEMTNPSAPTLFRWTNDTRGTKYIDEAEKLYFFNPKTNSYESDERAELINSGFKKTGTVPRQEKFGSAFKTVFYKTYSPTMCASINGLYGATEDRAIVHIMTKPPHKDSRGNLDPEENDVRFSKIRNSLYRLSLKYSSEIAQIKQKIDISKLKNRNKNIWHPILVLEQLFNNLTVTKGDANDANDANDADMSKEIYKFAQNHQELKKIDLIDSNSNEYKILIKLGDFLASGKEYVLVTEIQNGLKTYEHDHTLACKTITSHLDKMGFQNFRRKRKEGMGYLLSFSNFKDIASTITGENYSSPASPASPASPKSSFIEDKYNKNNKNKVMEDDANDGKSIKKSIKDYLSVFEKLEEKDLLNQLRSNLSFTYSEFEKAIKSLKEKGEIFEPTRGTFRRLD